MPNDVMNVMLQDQETMNLALEQARQFIERDYMNALSTKRCTAVKPNDIDYSFIRMCRFSKVVLGKENIHSRLMSVYHTMGGIADVCFLMIEGSKEGVSFYLGLRANDNAPMAENAMKTSLQGNFPGTQFTELPTEESGKILLGLNNNTLTVAAVSRIPSRRKIQDASYDSARIQGLERFIDAMKGESYRAIILAEPLGAQDVAMRRNSLEKLSSSLSMLEKISYQYTDNMTLSEQHSLNMSVTEGVSESVSNGYSNSYTKTSGTNRGSTSSMNTHFNSLGFGFGSQHGSFTSTGQQVGRNVQWQHGKNTNVTKGTGDMSGVSLGVSEGWTLTYTNKAVGELCKMIDLQLIRIQNCETYGCWDACAFFIAEEPATARVAAGNYNALVCGEHSGRDTAGVNVWSGFQAGRERDEARIILDSLSKARMPRFILDGKYPCSAGTMISSEEMPLMMNFPLYSVKGLPVMQMAAFGREVNQITPRDIKCLMGLGKTFHMGEVEENSEVRIAADDFTAHALICGTTGVGKSTAISMLLRGLNKLGVNFLLVEPVKGEYKYLLGKVPDLQVFTADPLTCRMLKINPFEFPKGIHVLAHIDRLIEVFSVCWPLYAAQPALLRECIEAAYIRTGWDLSNSVYVRPGMVKYPDFKLLLDIVPKIIKKSHFVGESKGTYEGALLTRIGMLTHGIYGQVFSAAGCVDDKELFDGKVIIDLSTVGSQETISLLMGILVIRLREYRMVTGHADNQFLKHVMVLEEAHNIFQRSQKQNSEGGESVGAKSVQMLSQCIAELRSYGQGVFIADQSPANIDQAAIRNTATKIIMQLPEAEDQHVVAESLSLTDEQMVELTRLPRQVALVYQGGWVEPVLMKINTTKVESVKTVDHMSYENLRKLRSECIRYLLAMYDQNAYQGAVLENVVAGCVCATQSKKKDYISLFRHYQKWYISDKIENSIEKKNDFYGKLIMELISGEDFFELTDIPVFEGKFADAKNDPVYRMQCGQWRNLAGDTLENYFEGLNEESKSKVLRLMMLSNLLNYKVIAVHNILYGTIDR